MDARAGEQQELGVYEQEGEGEGEEEGGEDDGGFGGLEGQEWVNGDEAQEEVWDAEDGQRDDGLLEQ